MTLTMEINMPENEAGTNKVNGDVNMHAGLMLGPFYF